MNDMRSLFDQPFGHLEHLDRFGAE